MTMAREKLEAIRQWSNDPCRSHYAARYGIGSERFFAETARYRYESYAPWLGRLIDSFDVRGKALLEVGCGMGIDLLRFAANGAVCTGIDLVDRHLSLAEKLFALSGKHARLLKEDAESLPFPDESFDMVYSFGVLHHTPGIERAVAEIHRVLKPNGIAVVGLYHKHSWHCRVNLLLVDGLLRGQARGMRRRDFLSSSVEISRCGARPLVNVYSRSDCRRLFGTFSAQHIATRHFTKDQLRHPMVLIRDPISFFLAEGILRMLPDRLPSVLGWYVVTTARR